uniref:Uncharacterized protein n=1 Tax=Megaselia scalaris TaxID=36166 RepID=T1GME3_MEGSC
MGDKYAKLKNDSVAVFEQIRKSCQAIKNSGSKMEYSDIPEPEPKKAEAKNVASSSRAVSFMADSSKSKSMSSLLLTTVA